MKSASDALRNILATGLEIPVADCFTFAFADGSTLRVTDFDQPVFLNGMLFRADHIRVKGLKYKSGTGLEIDAQEIDLIAAPLDTIGGVPFLQAVTRKVLDGCYIRRDRAYFDPASFPPQPGHPAVALDSDCRFEGMVAEVKQVGRTTAQITVKSLLLVLDQDFPRNFYQTTCSHTLFDAGCGLIRNNYVAQGSVGASPTQSFIPCTLGGSGATAHAELTGATGAPITRVVLTSPGTNNATYLVEPAVAISDPTGSGAALKAIGTISPTQEGAPNGARFVLYGIAVINGGNAYTEPEITITAASGDPGSGATAEAILGTGAATVSSIVIDSAGSNYSPKTHFVLTGGGGTGASYNPVLSGGAVTGVTQLSAGSGYSSAPVVAIVDEAALSYTLGTILFESGANAGQFREIKQANAAGLTLAYPLDAAPLEGDLFAIWVGCDHTIGPGGCGGLNNLQNYRGFPWIPPAYTAYQA